MMKKLVQKTMVLPVLLWPAVCDKHGQVGHNKRESTAGLKRTGKCLEKKEDADEQTVKENVQTDGNAEMVQMSRAKGILGGM